MLTPPLLGERLRRPSLGAVVFNVPTEMRVGVRQRVEVRAATQMDDSLTSGFQGGATPTVERVAIGAIMAVTLAGANFNIEALNRAAQGVGEGGPAQWSFDVTPTEAGQQSLHLVVAVRTDPSGAADNPVVDRVIGVNVLSPLVAVLPKTVVPKTVVPEVPSTAAPRPSVSVQEKSTAVEVAPPVPQTTMSTTIKDGGGGTAEETGSAGKNGVGGGEGTAGETRGIAKDGGGGLGATAPAPPEPTPAPAPAPPATTIEPERSVAGVPSIPPSPSPAPAHPPTLAKPARPGPAAPSAPSPAAPSVPSAGPAPSKPLSIDEFVQQELAKLPIGAMEYNPPDQMRVGVPERIEVRIAKAITEALTTGLKGRGAPRVEPVKVGTFMKVKLTGDAFDIKALSDEEQVVAENEPTEWDFDVTPQHSGSHTLNLSVTVRILMPGREEKRDYPVKDHVIQVAVNPVYTTRTFLANNWQWIIGSLGGLSAIVAFLGKWLVALWRKFRKAPAGKGEAEAARRDAA